MVSLFRSLPPVMIPIKTADRDGKQQEHTEHPVAGEVAFQMRADMDDGAIVPICHVLPVLHG